MPKGLLDDIPIYNQARDKTWYFNKKEVVLGSYGGHHDRIGFVHKDTGLPPTQKDIDNKEKNDRTL